MERVATGIAGLDAMLNGGLIGGRPYLLLGGPGSGKTTLCWNYLLQGARENEPGLYITLDEPADEIEVNMERMGTDDRIHLADFSPQISPHGGRIESEYYLDIDAFMEKLLRMIHEFSPTRVVIDSLTTLRLMEPRPLQYRRAVLSIMRAIVLAKVTGFLIMELEREETTIECALARGVIELLTIEKRGVSLRGVKIIKIRGTSFDNTIRPMQITKNGIEIFNRDNLFEY